MHTHTYNFEKYKQLTYFTIIHQTKLIPIDKQFILVTTSGYHATVESLLRNIAHPIRIK